MSTWRACAPRPASFPLTRTDTRADARALTVTRALAWVCTETQVHCNRAWAIHPSTDARRSSLKHLHGCMYTRVARIRIGQRRGLVRERHTTYRHTDRQTDRQTDGRTDGRTGARAGSWTGGQPSTGRDGWAKMPRRVDSRRGGQRVCPPSAACPPGRIDAARESIRGQASSAAK